MASEAEPHPLGMFKCQLCALTAPYSYVGQKPPDTQAVVLLEESYIMKDPFSSDKARFLILGSRCSVCSRLVCVGPECSLFYSKRVCLPCSEEYQCFPSGNPAGCGEEKGCQQEALQPSLTGRGTASCEALGWARPGFQLGAVYLVFSELCGVRAVSGTEELAKTEDRQQECSQLELQTWPLVEARSEGEGPPFDSW